MADLTALQAVVHGRVQGVFFRAFVTRRAAELGVAGYVRNRYDGSVEVYAEGERSQLEKLIGYLEEGPSHATVDRVVTSWSEYSGDYSGFKVTY